MPANYLDPDDPNSPERLRLPHHTDIRIELVRVERLMSPEEAQEFANALVDTILDVELDDMQQGMHPDAIRNHLASLIEGWLGYIRAILYPLENN